MGKSKMLKIVGLISIPLVITGVLLSPLSDAGLWIKASSRLELTLNKLAVKEQQSKISPNNTQDDIFGGYGVSNITPLGAEEELDSSNLITQLLSGSKSAELFTLPSGINEFDVLFVDGYYHLFYDDKTQTKHRTASTIMGLETAPDDLVIAGRYPTAQYEEGSWHLWVWDPLSLITKHYVSSSPTGPYTWVDNSPKNLADWHVRKSPIDGKYYASYNNITSNNAGIATSDSINGPWTDLGFIFEGRSKSEFHLLEEADAAITFFENRTYVTFAGWDGEKQRVCIVELDTKTKKAISPATVLVEPTEEWQNRNNQSKVFNPVLLEVPNESTKLFYAHNPSAPGVKTGWGYVEINN